MPDLRHSVLVTALLGAAGLLLPAAATGAARTPEEALDAERAQVLAELAAIRAGVLRAAESGCEQVAARQAPRELCVLAEFLVWQVRRSEAEIRSASGPQAEPDRTAAAARLRRAREVLAPLRQALARLERRLAGDDLLAVERSLARRGIEGGTGTVTGRVTDAVTGAPVFDVVIDFYDQNGNHVGNGFTDGEGDYFIHLLPGTYFALTFELFGHVNELYDDIPCPFFGCDVTTGTPITVTGGSTTPGIDFALDPGGVITGTVTDEGTGAPLAGVSVFIADGEHTSATPSSTDASGVYTSSLLGLPAGTYFALTYNSASYLNEVYDDIPCPSSPSCDPTTGTPISVVLGGTTSGIDFALSPGGAITGSLTDVGSGAPLADVWVDIFDGSGGQMTSGRTDAAGLYRSPAGLPTGTYFVRTDLSPPYLNELYDDIQCAFGGCNPTNGTPVAVTVGKTTTGIDFDLAEGGAIAGAVSDGSSGDPIQNAFVGIYDFEGNGVLSVLTDLSGGYSTSFGLLPGTYYARNFGRPLGYADERWDDLPCYQTCPVTAGTPITVSPAATTGGIDFSLAERPIFFDGLESGGLGSWGGAVGGVGCAHSMCTTGGPLSASCDPCVASICAVEPVCCTFDWHSGCEFWVLVICELECP